MSPIMILIDLLAISTLVFAIYFPRHRRADLVVAFLGVNVGVLAVSQVLATSSVGAGLGLGLFGVLSIIRLRSSEISQREVAYYFAALAIGLISGLTQAASILAIAMIALIVLVLAVADTRKVASFGGQRQEVNLDHAITNHTELVQELERVLGQKVKHANVLRLDLVNDITLVEVVTDRKQALPAHPELTNA
ncbi:DUF4956 domain-containing protein [Corynebacterium kozikiae]|uniref:DUF4956 domain-containing protein n=1 Tax=Corynebacterium kozikiae TaxID=2968469 RepID=UPI00211C135C|nr:DUF4956 domain-containing protein [Corynebacterium sp. 76QC2CO]MCQ9344206.1 DUF4956 domain-containing protein [Corynebacterium sp. 76QC2CO]